MLQLANTGVELKSSAVTVIVALPLLIPVTNPVFSSTIATSGLLLAHLYRLNVTFDGSDTTSN